MLDSSTLTIPSIITPSAGILSPASNDIISPTTTSSILISTTFPFLKARQFIFDDSSCNFSNAFSLPYSDIVDINDAKKIAITIPIVSYQSNCLIKNTVLIARAINKILMIGSPKVEI